MSRRGFALLATLWLVVMLSGVTAVSLVLTHRYIWTARNRVWLRRAEWARNACLAILHARYSQRPVSAPRLDSLPRMPRIDLGRGAWCGVEVDHPERRLNLNTADAPVLRQLLGRDDLTDAMLDWRDADDLPRPSGAESEWYLARRRATPRNGHLASVGELLLVRGFDSALVTGLRPLVTTEGDGRLDLNTAPVELLALLPGLGPEALAVLSLRRPLTSLEELAGDLSRSALAEMLGHLDALRRQVAFGPSQFFVQVNSGINETPITSTARVVLVPTGRRLAVVHVEVS